MRYFSGLRMFVLAVSAVLLLGLAGCSPGPVTWRLDSDGVSPVSDANEISYSGPDAKAQRDMAIMVAAMKISRQKKENGRGASNTRAAKSKWGGSGSGFAVKSR